MSRKAFMYLLFHEIKWSQKPRTRNYRKWWVIYSILGLVLLWISSTFLIFSKGFEPIYLFYMLFSFPFVFFGISIGSIAREKKNGTMGWWLSLPYSRGSLLLVKYLGQIIRAALILALITAALLLFTLYTYAIHHANQEFTFADAARIAVHIYLFLILYLPFVVALGTLMGALSQSLYKPAMALVGLIMGLSYSWLPSLGMTTSSNVDWTHPSIVNGFTLDEKALLVMIVSWLLAGTALVVSSWLLEKKLSL